MFQKLEVMKTLESQLTDFLSLIKFATENARGTITISFMSGGMILISSLYAVRAFDEYLSIGKFTFGVWIIVSIFFLFYSTERVESFHTLVSVLKFNMGYYLLFLSAPRYQRSS